MTLGQLALALSGSRHGVPQAVVIAALVAELLSTPAEASLLMDPVVQVHAEEHRLVDVADHALRLKPLHAKLLLHEVHDRLLV